MNRPSKINLDFSPAVIPLTKAFENELHSKFYLEIIRFCERKLGPFNSRWPAPLVFPNPYQNPNPRMAFRKNTIAFTLGSVAKIIDDPNFKKIESEFTSQHFCSSFNIENFKKDVLTIKNKYRDKVAHKEGITLSDAKDCRMEMMEVNKIFINFIHALNRQGGAFQ